MKRKLLILVVSAVFCGTVAFLAPFTLLGFGIQQHNEWNNERFNALLIDLKTKQFDRHANSYGKPVGAISKKGPDGDKYIVEIYKKNTQIITIYYYNSEPFAANCSEYESASRHEWFFLDTVLLDKYAKLEPEPIFNQD